MIKKLHCALFAVMGCLGGAFAAIDWDKDFLASFVAQFMMLVQDVKGGDLTDVSVDETKKMYNFVQESSETDNAGRMYSEVGPFMRALCRRMQKYIAENDMKIVLAEPSQKYKQLDGMDFLHVNCNSNSALLMRANLLASMQIASEQDRRAQSQIDSKTDNQRILEFIAGNSRCQYGYNRTAFGTKARDASGPEFECARDGNICVVNQMVGDKLYTGCCIINYNRDDYILEYDKVYDDVKISMRTNGYVNAPNVVVVYQDWPSVERVTMSDFDDACNPVLRLHDSKLDIQSPKLDDDDIDIVGDYELTRQQKLLNAAQKTRDLFQGMKIRR